MIKITWTCFTAFKTFGHLIGNNQRMVDFIGAVFDNNKWIIFIYVYFNNYSFRVKTKH